MAAPPPARSPAAAATAAAAAENASAVLSRDLPCGGCGYNLRALSPAGRCPECGQEVATSIAQWQDRWRRALSPARRALLLFGATAFLFVALATQWPLRGHETRATALALSMFLAWPAIVLLTDVRWDEAGTRWAGLPVAARVVAFVGFIATCFTSLSFHVGSYAERLLGVLAMTNLAVLGTTLMCVHVSRVANRLGWRYLSAQALCLAVLTALCVAGELVGDQSFAPDVVWLLPGTGEAYVLPRAYEQFDLHDVVRHRSLNVMLDRLVDHWWRVPSALATLLAIALMLQLVFAALFRGKPPKLHGDVG